MDEDDRRWQAMMEQEERNNDYICEFGAFLYPVRISQNTNGMLNKMKKILSHLRLVLAGCALLEISNSAKSLKPASSQSFRKEKPKAEVKNTFGSPDNVSYTDGGNEIWKYSFAKVKVNGTSFIPFYGLFHNGTNGTKKELDPV
jgi:hypothetical protein